MITPAPVESAEAMARLSTLAAVAGGRVLGADASFFGVSTDTRTLKPGDLFVALTGERFDGHDYARRAVSLGAAGVVVGRPLDGLPAQVIVDDTLEALAALAAYWRGRFELPLVAVAGSNGKTTTKQMLAAVLAARGSVLATAGNYNNHIGVPLTLLRLRDAHAAAVVEVGANHPGEIAPLAAMARPQVGLITASGEDHLQGFGTVEVSARTNGELLEALPTDGIAVLNADDPMFGLWRDQADGRRLLRFAIDAAAEVCAEDLQLAQDGSRFTLVTPEAREPVRLQLAGRHNVLNALGAAAAALAIGLDVGRIADALAGVQPAPGRGQWKSGARARRVLDDSYNANPASMRAALDVLAAAPAPRYAVLGDMGELGRDEVALHEGIGAYARRAGLDGLFAVGPLSAHTVAGYGTGARHFEDMAALLAALGGLLPDAAAVLVKGSRGARMERVVEALGAAGEKH